MVGAILHGIGTKMNKEDLRQSTNAYDNDGGGMINFDEFVKHVEDSQQQPFGTGSVGVPAPGA